jgi:hypothetical protein
MGEEETEAGVEEMEQRRIAIAGSSSALHWTRPTVRGAASAAAANLTVPCSDRRFEVTVVLPTLLIDLIFSLFFFYSFVTSASLVMTYDLELFS